MLEGMNAINRWFQQTLWMTSRTYIKMHGNKTIKQVVNFNGGNQSTDLFNWIIKIGQYPIIFVGLKSINGVMKLLLPFLLALIINLTGSLRFIKCFNCTYSPGKNLLIAILNLISGEPDDASCRYPSVAVTPIVTNIICASVITIHGGNLKNWSVGDFWRTYSSLRYWSLWRYLSHEHGECGQTYCQLFFLFSANTSTKQVLRVNATPLYVTTTDVRSPWRLTELIYILASWPTHILYTLSEFQHHSIF